MQGSGVIGGTVVGRDGGKRNQSSLILRRHDASSFPDIKYNT